MRCCELAREDWGDCFCVRLSHHVWSCFVCASSSQLRPAPWTHFHELATPLTATFPVTRCRPLRLTSLSRSIALSPPHVNGSHSASLPARSWSQYTILAHFTRPLTREGHRTSACTRPIHRASVGCISGQHELRGQDEVSRCRPRSLERHCWFVAYRCTLLPQPGSVHHPCALHKASDA